MIQLLKSGWLSLSSQPRRAFYSSLIFRQVVILTREENFFSNSTTCTSDQLLASRQREANSTAFQTAVNHLFYRFRPAQPKHQQDQTITLPARRILRSFRCFATPFFKSNFLFYKEFKEPHTPEEVRIIGINYRRSILYYSFPSGAANSRAQAQTAPPAETTKPLKLALQRLCRTN
ncbi:hypothetical protein [Pseudomonas leptonychotis]|uniref:hypothetical protein n=1 Tax=Pseudomonas leptonychotis TaxID=2448482 RepID=UPI0039EE1E4F